MLKIKDSGNSQDGNFKEQSFIFRMWLRILDKAFKQTVDGEAPIYTRPKIASSRLRVYKLLRGVTTLTPKEEKDEDLARWELEACQTLDIFSRKIYEVFDNDDSRLTKDDSFHKLIKLRRRSFSCRDAEEFKEIIWETIDSAEWFMRKKVAKKFERERRQKEREAATKANEENLK